MIVMDKNGNLFDERRKEDVDVEDEKRIENINEVKEVHTEDEEPVEKTIDDISENNDEN